MKKRVWMLFTTLTCCVLAASASGKGKNGNGTCAKVYKVNAASESHTGDKVSGPATVIVTNVNILRYDAQLGSNVSFTAGPDLSGLGIVPPVPKPDGKTDKTAATTAVATRARTLALAAPSADVNDIDKKFLDIVGRVNKAEDAAERIRADISEATEKIRLYGSRLKLLVESSDAVLRGPGGPQALVEAISTTLADTDPDKVFWPANIEIQIGILAVLKNDMEALKAYDGWREWYLLKGAAYEAIKARIGELQTQLRALDSTSDLAKKFADSQDLVRRWRVIFAGVEKGGAAGFTLTTSECCGFSFGDTKSTKIELSKRDRLAAAGTAPTKEEIVTVECTTPLSISGGFGFSKVEEKEFVFVPSKPPAGSQTPVNTFGFKNRSSFRTIPLLLINTRVWEFNDTLAVHASGGAGVDVKTGQAGTDIEYIVGGSLSFKRSFFVTLGLHVGRVPSLAGGFNVGDTVPSGVSAPPVEKTWKRGFVIAFSYKIR